MKQPELPPQTPSSRGFLKVVSDSPVNLSGSDRAALIRRGNEFYNKGNYNAAKRVFLTCRYSDGLIRLAEHHMKSGEPLEAFRLYWIAGDKKTVDSLAERMAMVLRSWIEDGEGRGRVK